MFGEITMWDKNIKVEEDGRFHKCQETRVSTVGNLRGWEL